MPNPIKTITVYGGEQYSDDWPPENLEQFAAWISAKRAEVPAEHRSTATITVSSTSSYGDHYATIGISYRREFTDEEVAADKASQREALERHAEELRRQHLALVERLERENQS